MLVDRSHFPSLRGAEGLLLVGDRKALHVETGAAVWIQVSLVVKDEKGSDGSGVDPENWGLGREEPSECSVTLHAVSRKEYSCTHTPWATL